MNQKYIQIDYTENPLTTGKKPIYCGGGCE